jgi:hypothetical protein
MHWPESPNRSAKVLQGVHGVNGSIRLSSRKPTCIYCTCVRCARSQQHWTNIGGLRPALTKGFLPTNTIFIEERVRSAAPNIIRAPINLHACETRHCDHFELLWVGMDHWLEPILQINFSATHRKLGYCKSIDFPLLLLILLCPPPFPLTSSSLLLLISFLLLLSRILPSSSSYAFLPLPLLLIPPSPLTYSFLSSLILPSPLLLLLSLILPSPLTYSSLSSSSSLSYSSFSSY